MYEVGNRPIYLLKRPYEALNTNVEDRYYIEKTFANLHELTYYLYHSYDNQEKHYWFDDELDVSGEDTVVQYGWVLVDGEFEKKEYRRRKQWMIAEEQNVDWLIVINPKNLQSRVDELIRRKGEKKQGPIFREEPVPGTGKRKRRYYSPDKQVKHTAWYREEIARQKTDRDDYKKFHPTPQPKSLDWNFYHPHSDREHRSWKNQKIQRQWMKNMPRHKERLI